MWILPKKKSPIFRDLPCKRLGYSAMERHTAPRIKPVYGGGNQTAGNQNREVLYEVKQSQIELDKNPQYDITFPR
jgi:hypothetical protein